MPLIFKSFESALLLESVFTMDSCMCFFFVVGQCDKDKVLNWMIVWEAWLNVRDDAVQLPLKLMTSHMHCIKLLASSFNA